MAMIRMEAIPLPRIVTEHHLWLEFPDHSGDLTPRHEVALEFTVDAAEEPDLAGAVARQSPGRFSLFVLAARRQGDQVGVRVPVPIPASVPSWAGARASRRGAARRRLLSA